MLSNRKAVGAIAGVVLVIAVIFGLMPLGVASGGERLDCGSALSPSTVQSGLAERVGGPFARGAEACEDEVADRRLIVFPLGGAAIVALGFLWLTGSHKTRWDRSDDEASGSPSGA